MKTITQLAAIAAAVAAIGTNVATASDEALRNRLDLQRQQAANSEKTITVAVYANRQGVSRGPAQTERSESRFEVRTDAHGRTVGVYSGQGSATSVPAY